MKSFNRLAAASAFTGVLLAAASVLAAPTDLATLVAQNPVSSQQLADLGQQSFEAGLEAYSLDVKTDIDSSVAQDSLTSAAPACIAANCKPWLNLNQSF